MKNILQVYHLTLLLFFSITFLNSAGTVTSTGTGGYWNLTSSWVGGSLPGTSDDVIIANGATVIINTSPVTIKNLTIGQGGTASKLTFNSAGSITTIVTGNITVATNGTLNITGLSGTYIFNFGGLLTNNGTFNLGTTSSVTFNGSASGVTIPSQVTTLNNLTLNNINGCTLLGPLSVTGMLTLTSGRIFTSSSTLLTLGPVASVSGGSDASFVNGPIAVTGKNGALFAPVGKGSAYRPVTATLNMSLGSGVFTIEQFESPATGQIVPSNVHTISALRYYHLSQSGNIIGTASIKLIWGPGDGVLNITRMTVVAGTNGVQWAAENNSGGWGGSPDSGSIATNYQSAGYMSNADFTLGSYDSNPLPVELLSFTVSPTNSSMKISWKTSVETDNHGFNVERSMDKSLWANLAFIPGHGNSNITRSYSYSDNSITKVGKYYYRLKQIDINGGFKFSGIVEADYIVPTVYALNQNYPNPFNPNTMISYTLPLASNVKISIYNLIGETVKILENGFKAAGNYSVSLNADDLPSGIYLYRLEAGKFSAVKKMILVK